MNIHHSWYTNIEKSLFFLSSIEFRNALNLLHDEGCTKKLQVNWGIFSWYIFIFESGYFNVWQIQWFSLILISSFNRGQGVFYWSDQTRTKIGVQCWEFIIMKIQIESVIQIERYQSKTKTHILCCVISLLIFLKTFMSIINL